MNARKRFVKVSLASGLVLLVATSTALGKSKYIEGVACHGANYANGEPVSDYANAAGLFDNSEVFTFWQFFSVPEVGVTYSGPEIFGLDPSIYGVPVNPDAPGSAVMSTLSTLGALGPFPVLEPGVPINDARQIFDDDGNRAQLPTGAETTKLDRYRNDKLMNEPITLARWNKAKGFGVFKCKNDGTGSVKLIMRNLIPQVPYTAWQVFAYDDPGYVFPFGTPPIIPGPLGGTPNTILPNEKGFAIFERDLSYCPLDKENPLMYIAILIHWDNALYGANFHMSNVLEQVDDAPNGQPLSIGKVAADHLCIPVGNHLDL